MKLLLGLPDPRDQSSLSILCRVQAGIKHDNMRQMRQHPEATHHNEGAVISAVSCMAFLGCFCFSDPLLEASDGFD